MAGKILQGVIQVLDRLYNFPGGTRGLTEFDLASPILPVHNVGRMAELGVRTLDNGYLYLAVKYENDTGGALDLRNVTNLYAVINALFAAEFRTADHRLWLISSYGSLDDTGSTDFIQASTGLILPSSLISAVQNTMMLWQAAAETAALVANGQHSLFVDHDLMAPPFNYPFFIPVGTTWVGRMQTANNGIGHIYSILWAGPIGVTPPGME